MPRAPRYRPPANVPPVNSPAFSRWILDQLRLIGEDLVGAGLTDVDSLIRQERLDLPAGATRRVSPTTSGTVVVLEAPSGENASETATLIIENPRGPVTVTASPHRGADGRVALSLINGSRTATFERSGVVVFHSNGVDQWKTVAESPAEAGAIGATGPAGPPGADGAGALRQIRREVFYTNGDLETYDEDNVLRSTVASSTWTIQDDGALYEVWVVASGSSGGSGARNSISTNSGGTGGGGPCIRHEWLSRAASAAMSPATIVVGAGVAGATGIAAGRTVVVGNNGTAGSASAFGDIVAHPGGAGKGGTNNSSNSGGAGGGSLGPGQIGSNGQSWGGAPNQMSSITANNPGGIGTGGASATATGPGSGVGSAGYPSESGGASGGGSTLGSGASGRGGHGGNSLKGGPGAGGGGGADATNRPGGGNGGGRGGRTDASTAGNGVTGPALSAGQGNGTDGTDGTDGSVLTCTPGLPGSGGQQALITSGAVSFTSGRGGHGGFPGGSGGGSGSGIYTGGTGNITVAAGGDSEDGVVVVVTYG